MPLPHFPQINSFGVVCTLGIRLIDLVEQLLILVPPDEFLQCMDKQAAARQLHLSRQRFGLLEQPFMQRDSSLDIPHIGLPSVIPPV